MLTRQPECVTNLDQKAFQCKHFAGGQYLLQTLDELTENQFHNNIVKRADTKTKGRIVVSKEHLNLHKFGKGPFAFMGSGPWKSVKSQNGGCFCCGPAWVLMNLGWHKIRSGKQATGCSAGWVGGADLLDKSQNICYNCMKV